MKKEKKDVSRPSGAETLARPGAVEVSPAAAAGVKVRKEKPARQGQKGMR
ncbi:hypothetical protein [Streptomyces sp. PTD5-9]